MVFPQFFFFFGFFGFFGNIPSEFLVDVACILTKDSRLCSPKGLPVPAHRDRTILRRQQDLQMSKAWVASFDQRRLDSIWDEIVIP